MKKILLALCTVGFLFAAKAQTTTYTVSPIACDTTLLPGGTTLTLTDDHYSNIIGIGFPFCYYGNVYTTLLVGSNTGVSFNMANANLYKPFNAPALGTTVFAPQLYNTIHGPMQDLNPAVGGTVSYYTTGTTPNRVFVAQYDHVPYFGTTTGTVTPFSGKIMLYETSNVIEVHVIDRTASGTTNTSHNAMLGIIPPNDTLSNNAPTFANNYWGAWTAYHEAIRFTPYGVCSQPLNYNLITGNIFFDANADCTSNNTDFPLGGQLVVANAGDYYTYTDQYGNYALVVDTGGYTVEHTPMTLHNILCPTSAYTTSFTTYNNTVDSFDFADTARQCMNVHVDVGATWQRLCRTNHVYVHYGNNGTIPSTASTVTVTLPPTTYFMGSTPAPASISGNVLTYNIGALLPNQTGVISVLDSVDCGDTLGQPLNFDASIALANPVEECDSLGNSATHPCHVVASWDPNDISALSQNPAHGYVYTENISEDDDLTFMIRFQNKGTAEAIDVRVENILPAELDEVTVVPGASSHQYTFYRYGNELRFVFNNINLPFEAQDEAGSMGFVKYRILQKGTNQAGTTIVNNANIYFDTNPAVPTNDAVLNIPLVNINPVALENNSLKVTPNPASDKVNLTWKGTATVESVKIFNTMGVMVAQQSFQAQLNIEALPAGMYYIQVENSNAVLAIQKLVITK